MNIIVDETKTITEKICTENKYATSFSVVFIMPIKEAIKTINPGIMLRKVKIRDFFDSPRRFKITIVRLIALKKGNVKTGQPPIIQDIKSTFQVD